MKKPKHYSYAKRQIDIIYKDDLPSKTDQSFAQECDVNNIMQKYIRTGQITHVARRAGVYADVSGITDLMGAFSAVERASDAFMTLPASLREKLQNDPANFVSYLQDPANREEAIEYGLFERTDDKPSSVTGVKPAPTEAKKEQA